MLKEMFDNVLQSYLNDKDSFHAPTSNRQLTKLPSGIMLTKTLPKQLALQCNITEDYALKGSIGKGNVAEIPHVCLFDKSITTSPTTGYYIVYLFDSTFSKVYLSLNQGWTQYVEKFGQKEGKKRIWDNTRKAQQLLRSTEGFSFEPISLNAKEKLGKGYELGNICSIVYEKDSLPEDPVLVNDLRNLMGVYRELKGLVGFSILSIKEKAEDESNLSKSYGQPYLDYNAWIVTDSEIPYSQELLNEVLKPSPLLKYSEESERSYQIEALNASEIREKKHGIVTNTLAKLLQANGYEIFNDRFRDLIATSPNGRKKLFEVKTTFNCQDIYKGVGQLLLYNIAYIENNENVDLNLVLPENSNCAKLKKGLLSYGISVLPYNWENELPLFKSLE